MKDIQTRPYVIRTGETVNDIASRSGLTVEQLKKVNQFRSFSKSFNQLSAGDEIDIPVETVQSKQPEAESDASNEQKFASASTSAAGMLASDNAMRAASDKARSYASERLNDEITGWLSSAGTARTTLSIDNKGRLNGSELDILIPFDDKPDAFLFTQAGIRHIDDRTTANLGIGQRHFIDNRWMFGYNGFLDYDLKRDHSRLGLGLEYGRDFLKVGTNGYFRLSNWKNSPDLRDYDERPANGFDIRSEAWLPGYPQIGGSFAYEQYFGDEVGIISKDVRGKNPAAFSAGLTYTPVPLVSLGLERKQGTNGDGNTLLNLGVNYDLGTPWLKQIDPDAVRDKRTLTGSRYDLVERNNQIVLEYRKQEVIRLKLPSLIAGLSGETKPLNPGINAKYGLDYVEWDDVLFRQGGGKIQGSNGQYSVVLPPYTPSGVNSWTISAVAYDRKGNASKRAETQISVTSAGISTTKSTFTSSEFALPSDGTSTSSLILELRDENDNAVTGLSDKIAITLLMEAGEGSEPTLSVVKETSPGTYEATLTAGSRKGVVTLTPEVSGTKLTGTTVELLSPATPVVKNLIMKGVLETGQSLTATYSFIQPDSDRNMPRNSYLPADASKYAWGAKGTTAQAVLNGNAISESGQIPAYSLNANDAGNIIELSVMPENSLGIDGEVLTIDTSMSAEEGNGTEGGDGTGTVINATARPAISGLTLKGTLHVNKKLSATYTFEPNNGDVEDRSTYAWAKKGDAANLAATSSLVVGESGIIPEHTLTVDDAGTIIEVAVQPRNGKNITGKIVSLATDAKNSDGNNTSDGGEGGIILDITSAPSVSNLKFRGKLVSGSSLTASYDFTPGVGVMGDRSQYAWGEKGTTAGLANNGLTIDESGVVGSRLLGQADIGKILELSVRAKNKAGVTGNTVTLTTADQDNGLDDNDAGTVIDPSALPKITDLSLSGKLAVGAILNGTYKFDANNGDRKDQSLYFLGIKGDTASQVAGSGKLIKTSGIIPDELVKQEYAGQILEVSVLPKNGLDVKGPVVSMATDVSSGNNFEGGNGGKIVDPTASPSVSGLTVSGKLITSNKLTATYTFEANKGDPTDNSQYLWGEKGKTAQEVGAQGLAASAGIERTLETGDIGKVIEVSVLAKNGLNKTGNIITVASDDASPANGTTDGGYSGEVVDALAAPSVTDLTIKGKLEAGESLSFTYIFNPNNGHITDASYFKWGTKNTTASVVSTGDMVSSPNVVKDYQIQKSDAGKVLEVSVMPHNGIGIAGTTVTVATDTPANGSSGGNNGAVIDPQGIPSIKELKIITDSLAVDAELSATYIFNPETGPLTDMSAFKWGVKGTTASLVTSSAETVPSTGVVGKYKISLSDLSNVLEVSVIARNGNGLDGNVLTANTVEQVAWSLIAIPPGSGYAQVPGTAWMWLPYQASGYFYFTNKQSFTSGTTKGTVSLAVDDKMDYFILNGKNYDTSSCSFSQVCTIPVDNLKGTGNKITLKVFNTDKTQGAVALTVRDESNQMLLNTSTPTEWTYYSPASN
ncbi:inverse autotransporter beta domain-containing protein (plasmid) [Enterobacter sp. D2]|nr:inverse autotransporter beta domain-containing protein [Enterobacter sp. D2]